MSMPVDLKYIIKENEGDVRERILKSLKVNSKLFLTNKWDQLFFVAREFKLDAPGTSGAASGKIDLIFLASNLEQQYNLIIVELKINKSSPEMIGQGLAYLTFFCENRDNKLIETLKKTISINNIDPGVIEQIDDMIENTHLILLDQWASYKTYYIIKKQLNKNEKIHYFCFGHDDFKGKTSFGHPNNWNCIIDADYLIENENGKYKIISEELLAKVSEKVFERLKSSELNNIKFIHKRSPGRLHRRIAYSKDGKNYTIDIHGQVTRI